MPRTSDASTTAELRQWKRTGNTFEGYIYNDEHKMYPDGTWRRFDPPDYIRVLDYDFHPYLLLQTRGWVFQLNRDQEDAG